MPTNTTQFMPISAPNPNQKVTRIVLALCAISQLTMFTKTKEGYTLAIKVIPHSKRQEILLDNEVIKIKVNAPPIDGKANQQVLKLLSKATKTPPSKLSIQSGEQSKHKLILFKVDAVPTLNFHQRN